MLFYLIRHAQTLPRDGLTPEEGAGVGISEIGKKRTKYLSKYLKNKIIPDIIYASPFQRSKETAEILSAHLNLPVIYDERITEYMPSKVLKGRAFKEAKRRSRENKDLYPVDGESFNHAAERFKDFLDEVSKKNYERPVVVSHALVIQAFLVNQFNLNYYPHLDEVSVTEVLLDKSRYKLLKTNTTSFIPFRFLRKVKHKIKNLIKPYDPYS